MDITINTNNNDLSRRHAQREDEQEMQELRNEILSKITKLEREMTKLEREQNLSLVIFGIYFIIMIMMTATLIILLRGMFMS